jgi:hypothetical protein
LNERDDCFKAIPVWAKRVKLLFDKVAVVIIGSASSWYLGDDWDYWRVHGTKLLRESGIAVFDFSSHIHRLVKDKNIHLEKTDDAVHAFGEYTVMVHDYMTACMPILLPEFAQRWDIVDENGKWAPVFNGTKLEFPTCKFDAPRPPPPPSGSKGKEKTSKDTPKAHPYTVALRKRSQNLPCMDVATEAEMDEAYKQQDERRKRSSGSRPEKDTYLSLGRFARSIADVGVPPSIEQQRAIDMEAERKRRIAEGKMKQNEIASEDECLGLTTGQGGATSTAPVTSEPMVVDSADTESSESVVFQATSGNKPVESIAQADIAPGTTTSDMDVDELTHATSEQQHS